MTIRALCLIASAAQLAGWAVIGTATRTIPPATAVLPLALALVLALSLIRAYATTPEPEPTAAPTPKPYDPAPSYILPRVVIAAVFVGIAVLVIAIGGVS